MLWHWDSTEAPCGATIFLLPPSPGTSQLLAGHQGVSMQGCQSWMQGPPIQGEESVPTLPSVPLCSLQLEEERDRADGYLRQSVMYLQSPQKSIREAATRLTGEPKPPGSLAALLQLGPGPSSGTQPSGCGTLTMPQDSLPPSPTLGPCALYMAQPCQGEEDMRPGLQHWCW